MRLSAGVGVEETSERCTVVLLERPGHVAVEARGPRRLRRVAHSRTHHGVAQIVRDIAAAEDEHALVTERRQRAPELEVGGGRGSVIDAQLHDGTGRIREQIVEDGPGPVIEPPVQADGGARGREQRGDTTSERRVSWRGVLHLEERARESSEIVDGLRTVVAGGERPGNEPVRGDGQDGARLRQGRCDAPETLAPLVVLDGVHRRAMADEQDRQGRGLVGAFCHGNCPCFRPGPLAAADCSPARDPSGRGQQELSARQRAGHGSETYSAEGANRPSPLPGSPSPRPRDRRASPEGRSVS